MKDKFFIFAKALHPSRLSVLAEYLLRDEAVSGKLILVAVAVALIAANTPLFTWYDALLQSNLGFGIADWNLSLDFKHWISEGLMVFFFLVVGLELKRELVHGELRHKETAILPFAAAVGGMLVPALLFFAFNAGKETVAGWAIPTATDIALAVSILALISKRIPNSIRIFLLALAIVDDILAVAIIAIFYGTAVNMTVLAAMFVIAFQVYLFGRLGLIRMWVFITAGVLMWLLSLSSGIHPSIVGAVLGLIAPISGHRNPGEQIAEKAERAVIPFSTLIVVPLFAFANTGISFDFSELNAETTVTLGGGIVAGLVIGKMVGIFGASWLFVKLKLAKLPDRAGWSHIAGIGALAGTGFTVAIFVTDLAFTKSEYVTTAKLSIFAATVIAALIGLLILKFAKPRS